VVGTALVQNGSALRVGLVARAPIAINLPRGNSSELTATIRYDGPLRAPLAAGEQVAMLDITAPGMAPASVPMFTTEAVGTAGPLDRIVNAIAGLFS